MEEKPEVPAVKVSPAVVEPPPVTTRMDKKPEIPAPAAVAPPVPPAPPVAPVHDIYKTPKWDVMVTQPPGVMEAPVMPVPPAPPRSQMQAAPGRTQVAAKLPGVPGAVPRAARDSEITQVTGRRLPAVMLGSVTAPVKKRGIPAWVWAVVGVGALILGVGAWWKLSKGEKGEGKGQPVASRVEAGSGEEGVIPPPPVWNAVPLMTAPSPPVSVASSNAARAAPPVTRPTHRGNPQVAPKSPDAAPVHGGNDAPAKQVSPTTKTDENRLRGL